MDKETIDFINSHSTEDIRKLALHAVKYPNIDLPFALNQISGIQTAKKKLPSWTSVNNIIYPPHLNMEQCSSEATARYKAQLANKLSTQKNCLIDLTGGFGVDFSFMSANFNDATYVERNAELCEIAKNNFKYLKIPHFTVVNGDGLNYLHDVKHTDIIFMDPARRNGNGGKVVALSDCTPNILTIKDELLEKADYVILKLSPMLDWHKTVGDLGSKNISEVHIISVDNECKELLIVMSNDETEEFHFFCVDIQTKANSIFEYSSLDNPSPHKYSSNYKYLYEPNASIMKAGCFNILSERYEINQIAESSHLFISDKQIKDFPGRTFIISAISSMNKKDMKQVFKGIEKANIATRNFPLNVNELKKRLKIKDGGDIYIFATTMEDKSHRLIICKKIPL